MDSVNKTGRPSRPGNVLALTDGELLARFVAAQEQAAFEELVRRHGPMVLRVCRRVLLQTQDAEDAFQATFIVLMRKAGTVVKQESLGSWLHGVAYRVALKARTIAGQRHPRESGSKPEPADHRQPAELSDPDSRNLRALLDEELQRLPEKYRAPVVLCYLEGKSTEEAARQLGCKRSALKMRLSRARERLRALLARRGLSVSAGVLMTLLAKETASAAVPATLVTPVVVGAKLLAEGQTAAAVLSPSVMALGNVTASTLAAAKLKIAAGILMAVSVIGGTAAVLFHQSSSRFAGLGDNSWQRVGAFEGTGSGSLRSGWCYDADRRRFVRVGGWGREYTNEIWTFDLNHLTWSNPVPFAIDPAAPGQGLADRPGYGFERGVCYDRQRQCVWEYGGIGSGRAPIKPGLWQGVGELRLEQWTHIPQVTATSWSRVAYDEDADKVICIGTDFGGGGHTYVYSPATGQTVEAAADPSGAPIGRVGMSQLPGFLYLPDRKGCLLVAGMPDKFRKEDGPTMTTWLFDATTGTWRDLAPKGPTPSGYRRGMGMSYDRKNRVVILFGGYTADVGGEVFDDMWVYDPAANRWTEVKSASGPRSHYPAGPAGRADSQMMAYDEEHNVHVIALQEWCGDNAVWVYRYQR